MLLKNIATNLRQQNWSVVFIEMLVVIVGLVLAFQVDRWWEERGDSIREQQYIARLVTEVEEDIEQIRYAIERFSNNPELIAWLPRTRGLQHEQILIHGIRISRAEKLLESLRSYSK